jgi:hypothetical protein
MLIGLLGLNTLFEFAVAIAFCFFPERFFPVESLSILAIALARVVGAGALAIGSLSLIFCLKPNLIRSREILFPAITTLTVFHLSVAIAQWLNFSNQAAPLAIGIIHSLFGSFFLYFSINTYSSDS